MFEAASSQVFKLHGLGNDFCFLESSVFEKLALTHLPSQLARKICSRNRGIGADGLVVWNSKTFALSIWNSDGSVAKTCGNALRCFGLLLCRLSLWNGKTKIPVARLEWQAQNFWKPDGIMAQLLSCSFEGSEGNVCVSMGEVKNLSQEILVETELGIVPTRFVQLENPHWVFLGNKMSIAVQQKICHWVENSCEKFKVFGAWAQGGGRFNHNIPESNIGLLWNGKHDLTQLLVYERGAGLTEACGSGACAAAVAYFAESIESSFSIDLQLTGGTLSISRGFTHQPEMKKVLLMAGSAHFVFSTESWQNLL
jgi:diaminopimelate epimerase